MVWACVLGSPYALGTRTEPWFGHACSCPRMILEHEQNHGLGMRARVTVCSWNTNRTMVWACVLGSPYALGTRTEPWFGHGRARNRMHDYMVSTFPQPKSAKVCTRPAFVICSLASKIAAWSTPQMTSEPSNPFTSPETSSFFYQPVAS